MTNKMQEWVWGVYEEDLDSCPSFLAYDFYNAAKKAAAMCDPPEIPHEDFDYDLYIFVRHVESGEMKMYYISYDITGIYTAWEW